MTESKMTANRNTKINNLREPLLQKKLSLQKLSNLSGMDLDSATEMMGQLIKTIVRSNSLEIY